MPKKKNLFATQAIQMRVPQEFIEILEKMAEEEGKKTGIHRSIGMIARDILSKTLVQKKK